MHAQLLDTSQIVQLNNILRNNSGIFSTVFLSFPDSFLYTHMHVNVVSEEISKSPLLKFVKTQNITNCYS